MENGKQRFRLTQTLIVVGIVAIIGISFAVNILGAQKHPGVPEKLLEMKVGNYASGPQALNQVNQLHGTRIELADAIIAEYSHDFNPYHKNDEKVSVWIGKTKTIAEATDLLGRMYQGIQQGKGNTPFSNATRQIVDGHEVFQVDGGGGKHFFYAAGDPEPRIVWLTINSDNTGSILKEALKSF
ncbi:MAG: hypothetical protein HY667_05790 [Chloroflexi bacterium]|nr:hypothetical protein [Chloroflexota bacterium]